MRLRFDAKRSGAAAAVLHELPAYIAGHDGAVLVVAIIVALVATVAVVVFVPNIRAVMFVVVGAGGAVAIVVRRIGTRAHPFEVGGKLARRVCALVLAVVLPLAPRGALQLVHDLAELRDDPLRLPPAVDRQLLEQQFSLVRQRLQHVEAANVSRDVLMIESSPPRVRIPVRVVVTVTVVCCRGLHGRTMRDADTKCNDTQSTPPHLWVRTATQPRRKHNTPGLPARPQQHIECEYMENGQLTCVGASAGSATIKRNPDVVSLCSMSARRWLTR